MTAPWRGVGARPLPGGRTEFRVWAPNAARADVHIVEPADRIVPLEGGDRGYHAGAADDVGPGALYWIRLDGDEERPDPASRHQPRGVHGPSRVTDLRFAWKDTRWHGVPISAYVLYELHVGTFTPEGTFDAVVPRLQDLCELGVTAVEIMPVAAFPGARNWGYDGVYPFAVHDAYGGPEGLHRLVEACHGHGLAVVLDVVYNHLGPEGNYLERFGPYFTARYRTPWGQALNFDGPHSDEVRHYFVENALQWVRDYHIDALRLDAIHGIFDASAHPFLLQLQEAVAAYAARCGRIVHLVSESDLNDARVIRPAALGGLGHAAQWADDLHHALHALLTGERDGYYQDFGKLEHLVRALRHGYAYTGHYSQFRRRSHGNSTCGLDGDRFVVCAQNHDQVGNRMRGERLAALVPFEALKLAAGVVLLSPYVPLLFMGEEYGETAPFPYFVSHGDADLVEAVRRGRREEFAGFGWEGELPDPQGEGTFAAAKLHWSRRREAHHAVLLGYYTELIRLRKSVPALHQMERCGQDVNGFDPEGVVTMRRWKDGSEALVVYYFGTTPRGFELHLPPGTWHKRFDAADARWNGPGSALPEWLTSDGVVRLELPALACIAYVRM